MYILVPNLRLLNDSAHILFTLFILSYLSVSDVPGIIGLRAHATFIICRHNHPLRGNQLYIV